MVTKSLAKPQKAFRAGGNSKIDKKTNKSSEKQQIIRQKFNQIPFRNFLNFLMIPLISDSIVHLSEVLFGLSNNQHNMYATIKRLDYETLRMALWKIIDKLAINQNMLSGFCYKTTSAKNVEFRTETIH